MLAHWTLAAVHLLALSLGFWAVLTRGSALRRLLAGAGEARSVLIADNLWGHLGRHSVGHRWDASLWRVREGH